MTDRPTKSAFVLIEEAIAALRTGGLRLLLPYYLGTIPFFLLFLHFWSEMSSGAYANRSLPGYTLSLTLVFIWMKAWQTIFANRLLAQIGQSEPIAWTPPRLLRMVISQTLLQSTGLFVLPVALIITLPFAWCYAFYQNTTLLSRGEAVPLRQTLRHITANTLRQPGQNHIALSLGTLFGFVLFLNLVSLIFATPWLLKTLFDIETVFSRHMGALLNSTILTIALTLTYLLLDPILKALYVLRHFYGLTQTTGGDLMIALRKLRTAIPLLLTLLVVLPHPASAAPTAPPPREATQLNTAIREVLTRPEYAWRAPRIAKDLGTPEHSGLTWINKVLRSWWKTIKKVIRWIEKLFAPKQPTEPTTPVDWSAPLKPTVLALTLLVIATAAYLLWQRHRKRDLAATPATAITAQAKPDLRQEDVTADQLPENEWLALAQELIQQGEHRLGMRALYLAHLAHLGAKEWVTITRAKSNNDLRMELARRARSQPELQSAFGESVRHFERAWYGEHPVTEETIASYTSTTHRILQF